MDIDFKTKYFAKDFIWLEKIDSTNNYIRKYINILKDKTVVATLNQTNGRGTKGKKFVSFKNKTLAISILLKNIDSFDIAKIPIFSSIVVLKSLKKLYIKNVGLKWFNDILIEDKKVCGILCESLIEKKTAKIIIGIGINLYGSTEEFKEIKLFNAGSIFSQTKKKVDLKKIIKNLVEELEFEYIKLFKGDIEINYINILKVYKKNCLNLGKYIKIFDIKSKNIETAKAIDISKNGELICYKNNNFFKINYNKFSIIS